MTCLTIYTDASVCPRSGMGGWACWAKFRPNETMQASAPFKEPVFDSTEAELKAIANSIKLALKHFQPENCILVVTTDSQVAINFIEGVKRKAKNRRNKKPNATFMELAALIKTMIPEGCTLKMKKVKAHHSGDGARSYVNGVVDKAARQQMRMARKKAA